VESPAVPPSQPESFDSPLARLAGVFASPGPTFDAIAVRPSWWLPLIICAVVSIAATAAVLPRIDFDSALREAFEARGRTVPEAQFDQIVATQKRLSSLGYVWAAFAPPIIALIVGTVLLLAFKAFGWEVRFKQAFGVTSHALLPTIGVSMLLIFFVTRLDTVNPADLGDVTHSNLGFLVDRQANPALHSLARSLDVFGIWMLVLLVIGFAAAANIPRRKPAILIGSLWAVLVLGKAAWTAIIH
jgi:Yip1-like protein